MKRVIVLTGEGLRHRYVVRALGKAFEIAGVVSERKRALPDTVHDDNPDARLVVEHFAARDRRETEYFGSVEDFGVPAGDVFVGEKQVVNSPEARDWVLQRRPDTLILYGCTIVRDELLNRFDGQVINMHLGLSPYYRGAATNFWPLVNKEPECVGVTLHVPTAKVDAGPVLIQGRPDYDIADDCHSLGCKTIIRGVELMPEAVRRLDAGGSSPHQDSHLLSKAKTRRDFTADAIRRMRQNFSDGMIAELLSNRARFDRRPIVT